MDQALNSQKTPHTSPLRASYGMSFVSILMKNDRVIKGFYCIYTYTTFTPQTVMRVEFHPASNMAEHGKWRFYGMPIDNIELV